MNLDYYYLSCGPIWLFVLPGLFEKDDIGDPGHSLIPFYQSKNGFEMYELGMLAPHTGERGTYQLTVP